MSGAFRISSGKKRKVNQYILDTIKTALPHLIVEGSVCYYTNEGERITFSSSELGYVRKKWLTLEVANTLGKAIPIIDARISLNFYILKKLNNRARKVFGRDMFFTYATEGNLS